MARRLPGALVGAAILVSTAGCPASAASAAGFAPPDGVRAADEVVSRRTTHTREWRTDNGGRVTRTSTAPQLWKDAEGDWHTFDTRLKGDAGSNGETASVADVKIRVPDTAAGKAVEVQDGHDRLAIRLLGANDVAAEEQGDYTRTFAGVLPKTTQRVSVTSSGAKEELVLRDAGALREFEYQLTVPPELVPDVAADGSVRVRRGTTTVFTIPRAVSYEADDQSERHTASPYTLRRVSDVDWRLSVEADDSWHRDPQRQWPVVFDPTIVVNRLVSAGEWCRSSQDAGGCSSDTNTPSSWLASGWSHGGATTMAAVGFAMPPFPASLSNRTITLAEMGVTPGERFTDRSTRQELQATGGIRPYGTPQPRGRVNDVEPVPATGPAVLDVTAELRDWQAQDGGRTFNPALIKWLFVEPTGVPAALDKVLGPYYYPDGVCSFEDYGIPCDTNRVEIATSQHPDVSKRPYVDIYSAPAARVGSEVAAPAEGKLTSRFVNLYAKATSADVSAATFEYVAGDSRSWRKIPGDALAYEDTGQPPGPSDVPVTGSGSNRTSRELVWDLNKTPGGQLDGPIHVRAILDTANGGGGGGVTPERTFRVDRKNSETSSAETVGPASVDLLTGDVAISETDAEVDAFVNDLKLERTYHSRGGSPRTMDMFGPGWVSSFEADEGAMPYRGIFNYTDVQESQELADWSISETDAFWESFDVNDLQVEPIYETVKYQTEYAVLEMADGSKVTFRKENSQWVMDAEHRDLKISNVGATFTVTDGSGGVVSFEPDASGSPNYRPTSYSQAGSSKSTTFQYTSINGRKRLLRVMAPTLSGVTCPTGNVDVWVAGCRALELEWGSVNVAGKPEPRVVALKLRAVDPSGERTDAAAGWKLAEYSYDAAGRLARVTDPHASTGLATTYGYDSEGRLDRLTPAGEDSWGYSYASIDGDAGGGRARAITRRTSGGQDAVTSFVFNVPLSGANAPNDLSAQEVGRWGQSDLPRTGTAVFPPRANMAGVATGTSWEDATIHYINEAGRTVNAANPLHGITTIEYDSNGNVVRELTARNRERALASSDTRKRSREIDTQHGYAANGLDRTTTFGPMHDMRRSDGSSIQARELTQTTYDVGKPASVAGDQHLVTSVTVSGYASSSQPVFDERTTVYEYSTATSNRGWEVKHPLKTTVGAGVEASATVFEYHPSYPLLIEKRQPKAAGADSQVVRYAYYGVGAQPSLCTTPASPAAAGGLLCARGPAGQPSSGHPLPTTYFQYSLFWDESSSVDLVPNGTGGERSTRFTTTRYDDLGRETVHTVLAPASRPVPDVTRTYSPATGRLETTTSAASASEPARTVRRTWNSNGQLATYTDATGGVTTRAYDVDGRLVTVADPRGARGLAYDARDLVSAVTDSKLSGPISVTRDADGEIVGQTLPGGIKSAITFDENRDAVELTWRRPADCQAGCELVRSAVKRDSSGRIATHQTLNSSQIFTYDSQSRVSVSEERRGAECVTRRYGYDKNSNRVRLETARAVGGAACASGAKTVKDYSVDGADRLTNAGYSYDVLGQTVTVPPADATTGAAVSLTHDADGRVASLASGASSQTFVRDPERRLLDETSLTAGTTLTSTLTYGDDDDDASGKVLGGGWERYVLGADDQELATVGSDGGVSWELVDLRANVVATIRAGANELATQSEHSEFGAVSWTTGNNPAGGLIRSWLGGHGVMTSQTLGGVVQMGARAYLPAIGRFLEPDPVDGGSATAYDYVGQDPINTLDLSGECPWCIPVGIAFTRWAVGRVGAAVARKYVVRAGTAAAVSAARRTSPYISGYTRHGLAQAMGRDGGRGVSAKAILDAVRSPKTITLQSGGRIKYKGKDATVVLSEKRKVISTWGKPRSRR